ncbi:hypothetical protein Bca4012_089439 [Brassica carinata]
MLVARRSFSTLTRLGLNIEMEARGSELCSLTRISGGLVTQMRKERGAWMGRLWPQRRFRGLVFSLWTSRAASTARRFTHEKLLPGSRRQNVTRLKLYRLVNEGVRVLVLFTFRSDVFAVPFRSARVLKPTAKGPRVDLLIPNKATKP